MALGSEDLRKLLESITETGDWWTIDDQVTGFGSSSGWHPWVIVTPQRSGMVRVVPRSSTAGAGLVCRTHSHQREFAGCRIDRDGRLAPCPANIHSDDFGNWSCTEPDPLVVEEAVRLAEKHR